MGVTALDLQNLIVTSLSDGDAGVVGLLSTNVPKFWVLWNRQGVLPELQFWYCRRDTIRYLMAYYKGQVDYLRKVQSATRDVTASSLQDASMDATASETASSNADRASSSTYSDATNASGSGSSAGNRSASQSMSGSGSMSDTGSGANAAYQNSTLSSSSTVNAASCDSSTTELQQKREVGGQHRRENQAAKLSTGFDIGASKADTSTNAAETESGMVQDASRRRALSQYIAKHNEARANSSNQSATQASSSYFNANRTTSESMSSSGSSSASSSSSSSYSMAGSGTGSMTGSGLGGSSMTASSTRTAAGSGEAHRLSTAQSTMSSDMEKLHQRVLHLKEMWQRASDMIAWFEKQRLNLSPYVFQQMTMQYPDGLNAEAANAYIVKTPLPAISLKPL